MKKRAYRAVKLRNLDQASLCEAVDGAQVIVGIDIAKEVQFAAVAVVGQGDRFDSTELFDVSRLGTLAVAS